MFRPMNVATARLMTVSAKIVHFHRQSRAKRSFNASRRLAARAAGESGVGDVDPDVDPDESDAAIRGLCSFVKSGNDVRPIGVDNPRR